MAPAQQKPAGVSLLAVITDSVSSSQSFLPATCTSILPPRPRQMIRNRPHNAYGLLTTATFRVIVKKEKGLFVQKESPCPSFQAIKRVSMLSGKRQADA